jgi:cap1 methyltransferase
MSVEGEENLQEFKVKQLVLCQFLTMYTCLAPGGDFVCKVFDMFTPFTVGLVYLLRCSFENVSIVIPYTSRPANSERYGVVLEEREG